MLWSRPYFAEMLALDGDVGARALLRRHDGFVAKVEIGDDAVLRDFDTVNSLATLRDIFRRSRTRAFSGRVAGEDVVAVLGGRVTGEAALQIHPGDRLAVDELGEPQPAVAAYFFESLTMN